MRLRGLAVAVAMLAVIAAAGSAAGDKTLRVAPHADLKVLDPHTNTATITLMHGTIYPAHGLALQYYRHSSGLFTGLLEYR